MAWTSAAKWGAQLISWPTTIVVARVLTPSDFGLVGMATVVMGAVTLAGGLGLGTTVVTHGVQGNTVLRQLNSVVLVVSVALAVCVVMSAGHLALFFDTAELVPVVMVLSAALVVESGRTIPEAVLVQDRGFRVLAGVEAGRALLVAGATLACALFGWGYWSLVVGYVASAVFGRVTTGLLQPIGFERPRSIVVSPVIRVSLEVMGTHLAWYAYSNSDFLVAGRILGSAGLGVYTLAWTLANAPVDKLAATLNRVSQPFLAAHREDAATLKRQFLRMTEGFALITAPACIGLALVADDLVLALLGPQWVAAAMPLRLLSMFNAVRCIAVVAQPLLLVLGESRHLLACTVAAAVGLPFCFVIGSSWGPAGIATAWVLAYPLVALSLYARVFARLRVNLFEYLSALRAPFGPTIAMALAVLVVRLVLSPDSAPIWRLTAEVAVGVATWVGTLMVFNRRTAYNCIDFARQLVRDETPQRGS